jgi:RimJ/RimL family protein N-acetyltransferase
MKIRELKKSDAPLMLEWMHDRNVTEKLRADFASKTLSDAEAFITQSWQDAKNVHMAIVSDQDEYMGTVSLKSIEDGTAEFAITVRTKAMGRGYSWYGMDSIIRLAFEKHGLNEVYWCVSRDNARAVRFYDKHGFFEKTDVSPNILERYVGIPNLKWYCVQREYWNKTSRSNI